MLKVSNSRQRANVQIFNRFWDQIQFSLHNLTSEKRSPVKRATTRGWLWVLKALIFDVTKDEFTRMKPVEIKCFNYIVVSL